MSKALEKARRRRYTTVQKLAIVREDPAIDKPDSTIVHPTNGRNNLAGDSALPGAVRASRAGLGPFLLAGIEIARHALVLGRPGGA